MADCILVGGGGGGTLSEDVTASKADVLAGKRTVTTDSGDEVVEGTMPNRGAISHSLALNGTYTVPAGYHNGSGKVTQALTVITPTTTNLALNGTYTIPQGWHNGQGKVTQNLTVIAAANHTLAINGTYTIPQGWHNGQGKVVQNVTTQGATNYYATTSAQTISSGRYLTGNLTIGKLTNSNLSAGNIKKGVTINIHNGSTNVWSVTGTWEGYVAASNDLYNRGKYGSYGTLDFYCYGSANQYVKLDSGQITFNTNNVSGTSVIRIAFVTPVAINMASYTNLYLEGSVNLGMTGSNNYTAYSSLHVDLLDSKPSSSDALDERKYSMRLATRFQNAYSYTWGNYNYSWTRQNVTKYLRVWFEISRDGGSNYVVANGAWYRMTLS